MDSSRPLLRMLVAVALLALPGCCITAPRPAEDHALIRVETRVLVVSRNFLDDFGHDWNFSPTPLPPPSPFVTGVPASAGLSTSQSRPRGTGSILDNFQTSILLRAVRGDKTAESTALPTLFVKGAQPASLTITPEGLEPVSFTLDVSAAGASGPNGKQINITIRSVQLTGSSRAARFGFHGLPMSVALAPDETLVIGSAPTEDEKAFLLLVRARPDAVPGRSMDALATPISRLIQREEETPTTFPLIPKLRD